MQSLPYTDLPLPVDPVFDMAPISLWLEDFSDAVILLDRWRAEGVTDIATYLETHLEAVAEFFSKVHVLKVNQRTLDLYGAADLPTLVAGFDRIFDSQEKSTAIAEIMAVWHGEPSYRTHTINHTLEGRLLHIRLNVNRLPDVAKPWDRVVVAIEDFTEQTMAKSRLEYLSTHDSLTSLRNRTFLEAEFQRLNDESDENLFPIGIIAVDVNGLKIENDARGHSAGDALLRRAADALVSAIKAPHFVARVGGDEFVGVLYGCDENTISAQIEVIKHAARHNRHPELGSTLSLSIGWALATRPGSLHGALREADRSMYEAKRKHYLAMSEGAR